MKKIITIHLTIAVLTTLLITACNKTETPVHNIAPAADAGKDTVIILPVNSILLDGSASTDKDNNIDKYLWTFISGPSIVTIANSNSVTTIVKSLIKGTYQFELTVIDKYGLTSRSNVKVTVFDPKDFTIKAAADTTIQLPYDMALLKVSGNNFYDPLFKWEKISGPNSFSIPYGSSEKAIVSNLVEGVYQFEINVTDYMHITLKDTMTITVLPDNNVYSAEKLFENIFWREGYSSYSFTIDNISSIILPKQPFKVYLKTEVNADWQLVVPDGQVSNELDYYYNFHFFINDNRLVVYFGYDPLGGGGGDYTSNSTIKIVY